MKIFKNKICLLPTKLYKHLSKIFCFNVDWFKVLKHLVLQNTQNLVKSLNQNVLQLLQN